MTPTLRHFPQIVRPARSFPDRGQAKVCTSSCAGARSTGRQTHDHGASDTHGLAACEQTLSLRQQRIGIITLYSLAILLAAGHVPGLGL